MNLDKGLVLEACKRMVQNKILSIQAELSQLQSSANSETKSSMGDKYETGRAMIMLEKEKLASSHSELQKQLKALDQIDPNVNKEKVEHGSIVMTDMGNFFLSTGLGKVEIDSGNIMAISAGTPIGQLLMKSKKGDQLEWRGKSITILAVY